MDGGEVGEGREALASAAEEESPAAVLVSTQRAQGPFPGCSSQRSSKSRLLTEWFQKPVLYVCCELPEFYATFRGYPVWFAVYRKQLPKVLKLIPEIIKVTGEPEMQLTNLSQSEVTAWGSVYSKELTSWGGGQGIRLSLFLLLGKFLILLGDSSQSLPSALKLCLALLDDEPTLSPCNWQPFLENISSHAELSFPLCLCA